MYLHTFKESLKDKNCFPGEPCSQRASNLYFALHIGPGNHLVSCHTFFSSFCMLIQCINCFTESESEQLGTHFQNIRDLLSIYLTHFQNNSLYASIKPDFNCLVFLYTKTFFMTIILHLELVPYSYVY